MTEINEISERIKQKAHLLFMQYGLRSVSMDDIATGLGMSKKTIYQFFADKNTLVNEVMALNFENDIIVCERDRKASENAVHEIFLAIDFIVEMFKDMNPSVLVDLQKHHPSAFMRFIKHKDEYLFSIIKNNLKRGIAEELYRADLKVDVLARFRVESMMMPLNPAFQQKLGKNLAVIEEEITLHYLYGIVSPKGYKLAQKYQEQRNKKVEA